MGERTGSSDQPPLPASVADNVAQWTRQNAEYADRVAESAWAEPRITWGVFDVPDEAIGAPVGMVSGLDVVELGCGTAYFSARLARRGARPVGVDPTPAQLATARREQERTGIRFPLVEAPAERVPLPDAAFDLAFSEYGASLWADPQMWIPEAARLLRPNGRLVFLTNSVLATLCAIDEGGTGDRLLRPQFGMYRVRWTGEEGVEYHLAHGEWIRLLRAHGFDVEDLIELRAPEGAETHTCYSYVTVEWASRWPAEEIWVSRRRG